MKKIKLGLVLTAAVMVGVVAVAQAATTIAVTDVTGSPKAGTKKAPAPFTGGFNFASDNGALRQASQVSYEWWWEGVQAGLKGLPVCTAAQIDAAQSDAACPADSLIGKITQLEARLGPTGDGGVNFIDCKGKDVSFYNSGPSTFVWFVEGPADQCAGVAYLSPFEGQLKKVGKETHFFTALPDNIRNPLPGIEGGLTKLPTQFINRSVKVKGKKGQSAAKGKKQFYLRSTACKGNRSFNFTLVDTEGTKKTSVSAGKCKAAPKPKKK